MENADITAPITKGWRFWAIFPALCLTSMLAAVESTVTSTALPYIVHELAAGDMYVWFVNAYFLTSASILPVIGQLADIFGRRWVVVGVVAIFTLGSGISGIGGGGINLLIEVVVSDLVPLRERGNYMALIFAVFCLGTAIGPFVGGSKFINPLLRLPTACYSLFLRIRYDRTTSLVSRLQRIDYGGTAILVASVTSILIALSWGGARYSWSSWHVVIPLILGAVGLVLYHYYETARWVEHPTLPEGIFVKRTAAAGLLMAFFSFILMYWGLYFLPVYFQAVLGATTTMSGVWLLPPVLVEVPFSVIGGIILSKTGRYKPLHLIAFAFMTLGHTPKAEWVIAQMIPAVGIGFMMSTNLSSVQADLSEKDVASATAAFTFMRSHGAIWGVSMPAAVFNASFAAESYRITNASVRQSLGGGRAYSFVTAALVNSFAPETREQVIDVFTQALRTVWLVSIAFAAVGLLLVCMEKEIVLRTDLETEFGLEDEKKHVDTEAGDDGHRQSHLG
ncbi:hypothetical protein VMCG_04704 [Cytospora schulzeri]|uniref:Major facilitator superfamily (MFS) profile domain-containing protein n=1 Tax=Cytospora schulzeri TaxID=448051 RepID=A0A423WRN1_9PEZI|nr:hypothetical protein VMCG_04704 [Valsa malicola]